jgi:glutathione S-transferase
MTAKLYVVHGSHPCATVERALQIKGIPYSIVEFPPPMHMALMRALFGSRTVPAIKFDDGEKLVGSRAILRRLDERVPEPALVPADEPARAQVLEAEAWGDDVLQGLVRRVLWPTFKAHPEAMATYSDGSKLPALPVPVLKAIAPVATRIEMRANDATDATYAADLATLPEHLDRIAAQDAVDLQIAPSLRLLMTLGDLRPLIEPRPAGQLALRLYPDFPGDVAPGAIPASLLPAGAAA